MGGWSTPRALINIFCTIIAPDPIDDRVPWMMG
jgi:hypothetical protein